VAPKEEAKEPGRSFEHLSRELKKATDREVDKRKKAERAFAEHKRVKAQLGKAEERREQAVNELADAREETEKYHQLLNQSRLDKESEGPKYKDEGKGDGSRPGRGTLEEIFAFDMGDLDASLGDDAIPEGSRKRLQALAASTSQALEGFKVQAQTLKEQSAQSH